MANKALQKALAHFDGNQSRMALAIGTSQQRLSYILQKDNPLPAELVLPTEKATGISRHALRPDLYPREKAA